MARSSTMTQDLDLIEALISKAVSVGRYFDKAHEWPLERQRQEAREWVAKYASAVPRKGTGMMAARLVGVFAPRLEPGQVAITIWRAAHADTPCTLILADDPQTAALPSHDHQKECS